MKAIESHLYIITTIPSSLIPIFLNKLQAPEVHRNIEARTGTITLEITAGST